MFKSKQKNQKNKTKIGFFICGLTGGPYFPIPAILQQLPSIKPILVGVKNSYEAKISQTQNIPIVYLPQVKLNLVSFKNQNISEVIWGILELVWLVFVFGFSFGRCVFLLLKYQPVLVYGTGSFLQVPMMWATKLTNLFSLTKTRIVVHQQDPLVGLATKLTLGLADLSSCVFTESNTNFAVNSNNNFNTYTKSKFNFNYIISNPIIPEKYIKSNQWSNQGLCNFVSSSKPKPVLLIFGGGSGALFINNWVNNNLLSLTPKYKIVHITGLLQNTNLLQKNEDYDNLNISLNLPLKPSLDYFQMEAVFEDMPVLMANVDLVICRAGLGSISELSFLAKPTFLVPLPDTHQELNAKLSIKKYPNFVLLEQKNVNTWLDTVLAVSLTKSIGDCNCNGNFDQISSSNLKGYYDTLSSLV